MPGSRVPHRPRPEVAVAGQVARIAMLLVTAVLASPDASTAAPSRSWSEVKCDRYKRAWSETLARRGQRGLGGAFLDSHLAFLDSGCLAAGSVCPRSPEEFEVANVMTILAMNAGAASTFLPFACRPER